jgi:hypothetical protein
MPRRWGAAPKTLGEAGTVGHSRHRTSEGRAPNIPIDFIGVGCVIAAEPPGCDRLVRVDYHGSKEVPTGTCHAILKAAGIKEKE